VGGPRRRLPRRLYDDDDDDDDYDDYDDYTTMTTTTSVRGGGVLVMASARGERSEIRRTRGGGQRVMMLPAAA
jgi:hypothetical protein